MVKSNDSDHWDLIIRPESALFDLRVWELWEFRDLLYLFTRRDITSFYKQTILGPLWFFVQPILTTFIYVVVFGSIAGISTDGSPPMLFYLAGITIWNYFADCFSKTSTVFRDNASIFGKVYFPRLIVPLSIVLSNLSRFGLQFTLFLLVLLWYWYHGQCQPNAYCLFLPLTIVLMAMLSLSFGMLFSAMTTKYRDLVFVLQFGIQLCMYMTPVIYPSSAVPSRLATILNLNPLSPLFEVTRLGFLGTGSVTVFGLLYATGFASMCFVFATLIFSHVERTFMDTV